MGPVVVDDANVYWIESAGSDNPVVLRTISKCGGNSSILATIGSYGVPMTLVLHDGYLSWVGHDGLQRMAVSGGPIETLVHPSGYVAAFDFDGDDLFTGLGNLGAEDLVAYPVDGGASLDLAPSATGSFFQVRVDCAYAFFTVGGDYKTELAIVSKSGGTAQILPSKSTKLGSGLELPGPIAMDAEALYWVTLDGDELLRVMKDGTSTIALAGHVGTAAIAVDEHDAYFGSSQRNEIGRVPKTGGGAFTFATDVFPLSSLAVDQQSVYWSQDDWPHGVRIAKLDK